MDIVVHYGDLKCRFSRTLVTTVAQMCEKIEQKLQGLLPAKWRLSADGEILSRSIGLSSLVGRVLAIGMTFDHLGAHIFIH